MSVRHVPAGGAPTLPDGGPHRRRLRATVELAAGPLVADTFDRPDAASLGTSSSGHLWTEDAGFTIAAQRATHTGDGPVATLDAGVVDVEVSALIPILSGHPAVVGRAADHSNFYLTHVSDLGQLQLFRRVAGTYTHLAETGTGMLAAGDRLVLRCKGSTISALVNATTVLSVTDTSLTAGTRVGIRTGSSGPTKYWDDFRAVAA